MVVEREGGWYKVKSHLDRVKPGHPYTMPQLQTSAISLKGLGEKETLFNKAVQEDLKSPDPEVALAGLKRHFASHEGWMKVKEYLNKLDPENNISIEDLKTKSFKVPNQGLKNLLNWRVRLDLKSSDPYTVLDALKRHHKVNVTEKKPETKKTGKTTDWNTVTEYLDRVKPFHGYTPQDLKKNFIRLKDLGEKESILNMAVQADLKSNNPKVALAGLKRHFRKQEAQLKAKERESDNSSDAEWQKVKNYLDEKQPRNNWTLEDIKKSRFSPSGRKGFSNWLTKGQLQSANPKHVLNGLKEHFNDYSYDWRDVKDYVDEMQPDKNIPIEEIKKHPIKIEGKTGFLTWLTNGKIKSKGIITGLSSMQLKSGNPAVVNAGLKQEFIDQEIEGWNKVKKFLNTQTGQKFDAKKLMAKGLTLENKGLLKNSLNWAVRHDLKSRNPYVVLAALERHFKKKAT